jgi:hypothetical protein
MRWPQELTPAVVRKHYPQFCASCPLGNLQDTDRYDDFHPTVIGQVELDLKTWTESSGKRAYSFSNQYISATCMDLKSGMIFGSTFTSRKNLLKWVRHIAHIFQKAGHKLTLIRADNEFNTKNIKDFCLAEHIDIAIEWNDLIALSKNQLLR